VNNLDNMMKTLFTVMIAKSILQKSAPPDRVNQNALIASLPAFPGAGGNIIGPLVTSQRFAQHEESIGDLQNQVINQRKTSLTIDEIVDGLNDGVGRIQNWDFVRHVFNPRSHEELKKSLQRPGKEELSNKILPIVQPQS
jgi:hypothetical protein